MNDAQFKFAEVVVRHKCDEQLLDLYCTEMRTTRFRIEAQKFEQWKLTPNGKAAIELVVADRWSECSERLAAIATPKSNWPTYTTWRGEKI